MRTMNKGRTFHGRESCWLERVTVPKYPKLEQSCETDVLIVGAGIAGLTSALLLAREGKRVIVIDQGEIGLGETGRTTSHLSNALDDHYVELQKMHGKEGAKLAAESHTGSLVIWNNY